MHYQRFSDHGSSSSVSTFSTCSHQTETPSRSRRKLRIFHSFTGAEFCRTLQRHSMIIWTIILTIVIDHAAAGATARRSPDAQPVASVLPPMSIMARSSGPALCLTHHNDVGVCVFLKTCLEMNGQLAGTCAKSFFFASCCVLPNATTVNGTNSNDLLSSMLNADSSPLANLISPSLDLPSAGKKRKNNSSPAWTITDSSSHSVDKSADLLATTKNGKLFINSTVTPPPSSTVSNGKSPNTTTRVTIAKASSDPVVTTPVPVSLVKSIIKESNPAASTPTTAVTSISLTTVTQNIITERITTSSPSATTKLDTRPPNVATPGSFNLVDFLKLRNVSGNTSHRPQTHLPPGYFILDQFTTSSRPPTTTLTLTSSDTTVSASTITATLNRINGTVATVTTGVPLIYSSAANNVSSGPVSTQPVTMTTGARTTTMGTTVVMASVPSVPMASTTPASTTVSPLPSSSTSTKSTTSLTMPSSPPTLNSAMTSTTFPTSTSTTSTTFTTSQSTETPTTSTIASSTTSQLVTITTATPQWNIVNFPATSTTATLQSAASVSVLGNVTSNTTVSVESDGLTTVTLSDICGITPLLWQKDAPRSSRIVGGSEAAFGEFPWQVSLRRIVGQISSHRCGAALVHPRWVITAAHCASDIPTNRMVARIGEYDFRDANPTYPHVDVRVTERVIHQKFNFLTFENDVALLRLAEPVKLAPHIIPLCLAPYRNYTGSYGTISGWGRLSQGGALPPILHKVDVPFIGKKDCERWFDDGDRHQDIEPVFICAGYKNGGQDACQGDSGGPVVQKIDGRWSLIGVISWGIGCAEPNLPGVSTLIPLYADWIKNATDGDVYEPDFYLRKYGPAPAVSSLSKAPRRLLKL